MRQFQPCRRAGHMSMMGEGNLQKPAANMGPHLNGTYRNAYSHKSEHGDGSVQASRSR